MHHGSGGAGLDADSKFTKQDRMRSQKNRGRTPWKHWYKCYWQYMLQDYAKTKKSEVVVARFPHICMDAASLSKRNLAANGEEILTRSRSRRLQSRLHWG